jgi:hypothetical protein
MDARIGLYYLCAATGLFMALGGIWLIYKEKIYIDRESGQPIEIELPLGRFKSNYPALALFVIGFVPLIYPLYAMNNLSDYVKVQTIPIRGPVSASAYPVVIYASPKLDTLTAQGEFRVPVPFLGRGEDDYRMLLVVNGQIVDEARAVRERGGEEITVQFRSVEFEPAPYRQEVADVPDRYR